MMRLGLVLLPLALCSAPAFAQAAPPLQIPPQLVDSATAEKLANGMEALSGALLNLKVGDVRAAVEGRKATPAEHNLTVGDLARREDPEFQRHLQQRIDDAKPKIEQSIKALNQALPEITSDLERARQSIERAMANMPDPNYPRR
jgi:hypothetical protein